MRRDLDDPLDLAVGRRRRRGPDVVVVHRRGGRAGIRRLLHGRRHGRRRGPDGVVLVGTGQILAELLLQVGLGAGGEDAGSPQLVDDEQQDEQPEGHQRPAHTRNRTPHGPDRTGCAAGPDRAADRFSLIGPVRRSHLRIRKLSPVPHPRSPELWLRCVRLRSAVCMLGRFPALAGADLEVDAGEVVLLSGPNGAGKTTLLRLCAGLLALRGGRLKCSVSIWRSNPAGCAGRSRSSATRPSATTT